MLPNVGEPMMLQAAAMIERHYSTAQHQNDIRSTPFPACVVSAGNLMPALPSFNVAAAPPALSVPPVNTILSLASDCQDNSSKVLPALPSLPPVLPALPSLPPLPFNVNAQPPFRFTPVMQPQNTLGSAVPHPSVLPPLGTALIPTTHMPLIPQHSLPPFGAVLPPKPALTSAVPFQATLPPLAAVLPANNTPILPPNCLPAVPPVNLMPPPNSYQSLATALPMNSIPPFCSVIPPNSVPTLSTAPVLNAKTTSILPLNTAPLLRAVIPSNTVPPFSTIPPQPLSSCTPLSGMLVPDSIPPPDVTGSVNIHPALCGDPISKSVASNITTTQHVNSTHMSHEPVALESSDTRSTSVMPSAVIPAAGSRKILRPIVGRGNRDQIPESKAVTESGVKVADAAFRSNVNAC